MCIALHSKKNLTTKDIYYVTQTLTCLQARGVHILLSKNFHHQIKDFEILKNITLGRVFSKKNKLSKKKDNAELVITLGGDGTLLDTLPLLEDKEIPIVGINLGRLGFLNSVRKDEIPQLFEDYFAGKFFLDKRSLLEVMDNPPSLKGEPYALNEIALLKKDTSSMIDVQVFVDGQFLNSYWADGIILATPTGSTGYSLSCGGPLLWSSADIFVLTPVSAHNMNMRPMVVPNKAILKFQINARTPDFLVSLDARSYTVSADTIFEIALSPFEVNLVRTEGYSYLDTLRKKLLWGAHTHD